MGSFLLMIVILIIYFICPPIIQVVIFFCNLFVPDPIPFVDELFMVLTFFHRIKFAGNAIIVAEKASDVFGIIKQAFKIILYFTIVGLIGFVIYSVFTTDGSDYDTALTNAEETVNAGDDPMNASIEPTTLFETNEYTIDENEVSLSIQKAKLVNNYLTLTLIIYNDKDYPIYDLYDISLKVYDSSGLTIDNYFITNPEISFVESCDYVLMTVTNDYEFDNSMDYDFSNLNYEYSVYWYE